MTNFVSHSWVDVPADFSEPELDTSWRVGDKCEALFSEDGEYYRAKVIQVKDWKNAVIVRFSDYGNEEEVKMINMAKLPQNAAKVRLGHMI